MSGVAVKDQGWRDMLARAREIAKGRTVRVGVLADAPKREADGGTSRYSLLEVAAVHEFGAPGAGIPQRSFIRGPVDAHAADIVKLTTAVAKRTLTGELAPEQALNQIGAKVASWCQGAINDRISPALSPETIARRPNGGDVPLLDTGQLKSSITWKVVGE